MTNEEKKKYILKNWSFSSGKRISEMLKRYFLDKVKPPEDNIYNRTLEVFENPADQIKTDIV